MSRFLGVSAVVVPVVLFVAVVGFALWDARPLASLQDIGSWYDPLYLVYDLLLLLSSVLFIPFMAMSYVFCMKDEKAVRIRRELGALWPQHEERVMGYINSQFRPRDYVTGVAAMMIVVLFGGIALLILKPVWGQQGLPQPGIDFSQGASLLLLGSGVESAADTRFHVVSHALIAFAFGFLGAYIYSITQIVRGYFTTDLNASSFVASTTRMIIASTVAMVVASGASAMIGPSSPWLATSLPLVAFFFGVSPKSAMRVGQRLAGRALGRLAKEESWGETSLNKISGTNINHVFRLEREGFDNAENLACADAIELAMRTGFPYVQVKSWIDEARLLIHLGDDFRGFTAGTGIRTYEQLCTFVKRWDPAAGSWSEHLAKASGKSLLATKLDALVRIADVAEPPAPPTPVIPIRGEAVSLPASSMTT
ncbi:MAG TPA: hypothetical protein VG323_02875 [Thermoanaerobaculia bacterium]|nr:hypothetical protein [Thermoanaerobaculia bacterium]